MTKKRALDQREYLRHELLDRVHVLMENLETHITNHNALAPDAQYHGNAFTLAQRQYLSTLADNASEALVDMYNYIGGIHL
jgi:predicted glycosyltransferase involved in capsule biosynthesis